MHSSTVASKQINTSENADTNASYASGAQAMDWRRKEFQTGFPDIEAITLSLIKVAESTWLRQVSAWIPYGTLPSSGEDDFLVGPNVNGHITESSALEVRRDLSPKFVTPVTAESILFIGRSLEYVRRQSRMPNWQSREHFVTEPTLTASHLKHLTSLN